MPVVPGVLADQVHVDHSERHHIAAHDELVRERYRRGRVVCQLPLRAQLVELLVSALRVDLLEVGRIASAAIQRRHVVARNPLPQPDALHLRKMTHQPQQRQR